MADPNAYTEFNNDTADEKQDASHTGNVTVQVQDSVPPVAYGGQPVMGLAPVPPAQSQYGPALAINPVLTGPGPPVVNQPSGQSNQGKPGPLEMIQPQGIPGCPPGLEYLAHVDQVLIHQQIEIAEVFLNIDFQNKYVIKNSVGQQIYLANEESEFCQRLFCGSARGFVVHLNNNMGQELLRVVRVFKCCAGCCWCADDNYCAYYIAVESPPGNVIGYVRQTKSWLSPHFDILTPDQVCVLKIRGHWCRCQAIFCTDDIDFKIMSNNLQTEVGKISKQWGGWVRETFTKADNFCAQFPLDMDVKIKATILASAFLIDFMFFEHKKKNKRLF